MHGDYYYETDVERAALFAQGEVSIGVVENSRIR